MTLSPCNDGPIAEDRFNQFLYIGTAAGQQNPDPNGVGCPAFDRPGDDHLFLGRKEPRLFAWDAERGADPVHISIQLRECIALPGAFTA